MNLTINSIDGTNNFSFINNNTGSANSLNFITSIPNTPVLNFLIVGGGGGGGGESGGGGGGAGGIVVGSFQCLKKDIIQIIVGAGGAVNSNGASSSIKIGNSFIPILAYGGGSGGFYTNNTTTLGGSGGSGGGAYGRVSTPPYYINLSTGGSVLSGKGGILYGNIGGGNAAGFGSYTPYIACGGGGGAGEQGATGGYDNNSGRGGNGIINPILNSTIGQLSAGNYWIAGGGGGGLQSDNQGNAQGGLGGGGASGIANYPDPATPAVAGLSATGGGGGGSSYLDYDVGTNGGMAAAGGSGVIIITYNNLTRLANGGTITNPSSNYWIHTFTSSGTFTFI